MPWRHFLWKAGLCIAWPALLPALAHPSDQALEVWQSRSSGGRGTNPAASGKKRLLSFCNAGGNCGQIPWPPRVANQKARGQQGNLGEVRVSVVLAAWCRATRSLLRLAKLPCSPGTDSAFQNPHERWTGTGFQTPFFQLLTGSRCLLTVRASSWLISSCGHLEKGLGCLGRLR